MAKRVTAAAFLATLGPVCVRCGLPAVLRFGVDLVEPDSGVKSCERCGEMVWASLLAAIAGDEVVERLAMKMPKKLAKERKAEVEALAREKGWPG